MTPAQALTYLTILVALPLNVYVTVKLWRLSNATPRRIGVLRERAIVATALTIIVLTFAAIFLNNDTVPPLLDTGLTKLITRVAVLGLSILPAIYWLRLYHDEHPDA